MPATAKARGVIEILRDILTELNRLSDEQLQALIDKEATFKYSGAKKVEKKTSISQERIDEITDFMSKCNSLEGAKLYIEERKLTIPNLRDIAKHIDITLPSKNKEIVVNTFVEIVVGARLRFESIQRT